MNCKTLLSVFALFTLMHPAFSYETIDAVNGDTLTSCMDTLYDDGGPTGNYTDDTSWTVTIMPQNCADITVYLNVISLRWNDTLDFYDGADTTAPLLERFRAINQTGNPYYTFKTSGGALTIKLYTQSTSTRAGFEVIWQGNINSSAIVTNPVSCYDSTDGSIKAFGSGGIMPYSYEWFGENDFITSPLGSTQTLPDLGTDKYFVKVTDNYGCLSYDSVFLSEPPLLTANALVSAPITCNGNADGEVTGIGSGGTQPYAYRWYDDPGMTSQIGTGATESPLDAATYYLKIEDDNACTATDSVMLPEPEVLTVSTAVSQPITCSDSADGEITATGTNGTPPFDYEWFDDPGLTSSIGIFRTIAGLDAGTYYAKVTDDNGCSASRSIVLPNPAPVTSNVYVSLPITCAGASDGEVTAKGFSGTAPYSYEWYDNPAMTTVIGSNAILPNQNKDTLYVVVKDDNLCPVIDSIVITDPVPLEISTYESQPVLCNGDTNGTLTATASAGSPPYDYTWYSNSIMIDFFKISDTSFASNLGAGTYYVKVTDAKSCETTASKAISEPAMLTVTADIDEEVSCYGLNDGSVTCTPGEGTPPYTYEWYSDAGLINPIGQATQTATGLSADTFYVEVTDKNGCTADDDVILTQPDNFTASFSILSRFNIDADPLVLSGSPPGGIFTGPGITSDDSTFHPAVAGIGNHVITYTYTQPGTGCTDFHQENVEVDSSGASISNLAASYCVYDATDTIYGTNDLSSPGSFSGAGITNLNSDTAVFNPKEAHEGSHTITYTYFDGPTPVSIDQNIVVDSAGQVSFTGLAVKYCADDIPVALTAVSLYPPGGTGTWAGPAGSGFPASGNSVTFSPGTISPDSTYEITFTYTSPYGCVDDTTQTTTVYSLPDVSFALRNIYNYEEPPVILSGIPSGGEFSGPGVNTPSSTFTPQDAGLGTKSINYQYTEPVSGCTNDTTIDTEIDITDADILGVNPGNQYCFDGLPDTLTGDPHNSNGQPGRFHGPGIDSVGFNKAVFNPAIADTGNHQIIFEYTHEDDTVLFQKKIMLNVEKVDAVWYGILNDEYCADADDVVLVANHPPGGAGTFFGLDASALTDGGHFAYLKPSHLPDDSTYLLSYEYTSPKGCTNDTTYSFRVNALPQPDFNLNPTYNIDGGTHLLTGIPPGGVFSGPGISGNNFNPAFADTGIHTITYAYTDTNACFNSTDKITQVVEANATILGLDSNYQYCYDGTADTIAGVAFNGIGIPGIFTGAGITNIGNDSAIFNPSAAGPGDHTITFEYFGTDTVIFRTSAILNVDSIGNIDFIGLNVELSYCTDASPVELVGNPSGGVFSGPGIAGNFFNPASASLGIDTINYLYTNTTGCTKSTYKLIEINDLPLVSFMIDSLFCANEPTVEIQGKVNGSFIGAGNFSGDGISSGGGNDGVAYFNPSVPSIGDNSITFEYEDPATGCINSIKDTITVFDIPVLAITSGFESKYCIDEQNINLQGEVNGSFINTGSFAGNGIADSVANDGIAVFLPDSAGAGNVIISYTYTDTNGCTNTVDSTTTVYDLPLVSLTGFNAEKAYCEDANPFAISGFPSGTGGIYTIGLASGPNLNTFDPSAYLGKVPVSYEFTDVNGCVNTFFDTVIVNEAPDVHFSIQDECMADSIQFYDNTVSNDSIASWQWNFGDAQNPGSNTSSKQHPRHLYTTEGVKIVYLTVTSISGCSAETDSAISLGSKPDADFYWSNECFEMSNPTSFFNTTSGGGITSYLWDFGDGDTDTTENPQHQYTDAVNYQVSLVVRTANSCTDTVLYNVYVRPFIRTYPYFEDFENGDGGWLAESADSIISWELGAPQGIKIDHAASGNNAWVTDLNGNYYNNEDSWVIGPCFDFSGLQKPMIRMKIFNNTHTDIDGAVLQASTDDGFTWTNIGTLNDGINWYNSFSISGNPGGQKEGWSDDSDTNWVKAMHGLDNLAGETSVRFRIAFGSGTAPPIEGFAFDDIWIGERSRIVLIEHFTNTSDNQADTYTSDLDDYMVTNQLDAIDIQYHTSFPGADPMNTDNPAPPSARALYYGTSSVPHSVMDGNQFNNHTQSLVSDARHIKLRALESPLFNIQMETDLTGDLLKVNTTLKARESISDRKVILQVAVVEKQITDYIGVGGKTTYRNVLKTMLPNAGGTRFTHNWNAGEADSASFNWTLANVYDPESLSVIIFVQDENTKEIYQAATDDTTYIQTGVRNRDERDNAPLAFAMYPNPAADYTFIAFNRPLDTDAQIEIYNSIGMKTETIAISKGITGYRLETSQFSGGLYYIKLRNHRDNCEIRRLVLIE